MKQYIKDMFSNSGNVSSKRIMGTLMIVYCLIINLIIKNIPSLTEPILYMGVCLIAGGSIMDAVTSFSNRQPFVQPTSETNLPIVNSVKTPNSFVEQG